MTNSTNVVSIEAVCVGRAWVEAGVSVWKAANATEWHNAQYQAKHWCWLTENEKVKLPCDQNKNDHTSSMTWW